MQTAPLLFSPYCVFIPGPNPESVTVVHSEYGSRFVMDASLLAALLAGRGDPRTRPSHIPRARWATALAELLREHVLVNQQTYRRIQSSKPFTNRLNPLELALVRGVNEGGVRTAVEDPPPAAMKRSVPKRRSLALGLDALDGDVSRLADSLAARQSIRTYSDAPLRRRQLEQFLRLTGKAYAHIEHPGLGPTSLRNYPSGGARYPLEIYPVLLNVDGFDRGFYYYQPFHHRLEYLGSKPRQLDALREAARTRMDRPSTDRSEPAALLIITALWSRTCWKYHGIPLQLILQETGALYATMYLAATALQLAPCAVGAFPERAVGEILGLESREEAQVGLFALGVQRESPPAPLTIDRFIVRRGSPFSPDRSRHSVELVFADGQREIIDARAVTLARAGRTLTCRVQRGRRQAVFSTNAARAIRKLLTEQDGVVRCRFGRDSVIVAT